ncbi:hypothetical protein GCM10023224_13580 [Streptomonospora halophila]|uniref:OmpA-like domain-containing protein n=1 Tax=Streptomonospora halophila TaxID=427369 RepID=A0ABP9GBB7_9ACTN
MVLDFSMTNLGSADNIIALKPPREGDAAADSQPFALVDGASRKKHLPLLHSSGECYCSNWTENSLSSGESLNGWIAFPAPTAKVESMILTSSIAPPILDIPVSDGDKDNAHPPSGKLDPPRIWDIRSLEDDLSEDTVRQETGDEVAISLSTDVLFAVGESVLDDEARESLEQVANEIDGASGKTVRIDGHTDDSGTDAINDPLSQKRAQAVEESLSSMISRSGIEFDVKGHGSDQPIATNETEEGKQKNRRVTITFTK